MKRARKYSFYTICRYNVEPIYSTAGSGCNFSLQKRRVPVGFLEGKSPDAGKLNIFISQFNKDNRFAAVFGKLKYWFGYRFKKNCFRWKL